MWQNVHRWPALQFPYRKLEIRVNTGHSRSLKVVPFSSLCIARQHAQHEERNIVLPFPV